MMAEKRWFLLFKNEVMGPLLTGEVKKQVSSEVSGAMIWWRGQKDWLPFTQWEEKLPELIQPKVAKAHTPIWKMVYQDKESKPMQFEELMENLRRLPEVSGVALWTEGLKSWQSIFTFHKIVEELGISQRKHPRVPINGSVVVSWGDHDLTGRPRSISEGGIGLQNIQGLKVGQSVRVLLRSPAIYTPIKATAEVVYIGADNYAGLRFTNMNTETESIIIEYVRKYFDEANKKNAQRAA